ncbi:MAG: protein kinase [Syntrophobacterales bacterium]|nr:protein kinase [Syntrophobacterales bacterium]
MDRNFDDIKARLANSIEEIRLYKLQGLDDILKDAIESLHREILSSPLSEEEKAKLLSDIEREVGSIGKYIKKEVSLDEESFSELSQAIREKSKEIRFYYEQGMDDIVRDLVKELMDRINRASTLREEERKDLYFLIEDYIGDLSPYLTDVNGKYRKEETDYVVGDHSLGNGISEALAKNPSEQFVYAKNLMNIHQWDEAISVLKLVAATGYRYEECYELCGDCAYRAGRYNEALEYYEIVYNIPELSEETRRRIFDKITKCRQRKFIDKIASNKVTQRRVAYDEHSSFLASHLEDLSRYVGDVLRSWKWNIELPWQPVHHSYDIKELLQLGTTWAVFDVSRRRDGKSFIAITLIPNWKKCVDRNAFIEWVYVNMMLDSEYISIPEDLAVASDGTLFVVRPYYEYSLAEYMAKNRDRVDIEEVLVISYQILEGLGYLHLHFAKDKQKRRIYHLDLRPSRIFLTNGIRVKIAYGGLWRMLSELCPHLTSYRALPLAFLAYRAPEQFRPYLWNPKKPLVCTDIYQFGVILYEMLTGINPFLGESVEEIEMLHCDQKPIPPQVAKPDLPEEIGELVMNCLNVFPSKRWRSTTQILLSIEKMLGGTSRIREIIFRKKGEVHERMGEG